MRVRSGATFCSETQAQSTVLLVTEVRPRNWNRREVNKERCYYCYIMQSISRHVLYIGVTSNLGGRVRQHKEHVFEGFSSKYNTTRLVYFEVYDDIRKAIARETQLKKWRREKKERLIETLNPHWDDLSEAWGKTVKLLTPKL